MITDIVREHSDGAALNTLHHGGDTATATIESLSHDSRGVARIQGKTVFIEDALPGEVVRFRYHNKHKNYDTGRMLEVLQASPDRVPAPCPYFGTCGGCNLQHLRSGAQIAAKQQVLEGNLKHLGKVEPETWLAPLTGPAWGYRRRARPGVRLVPSKGGVLVGFRARRQNHITHLDSCMVLEPKISGLLPELRALISRFSCANRIPQVEIAVGDNASALVFRHLVPLHDQDRKLLCDFGERHALQIFVQPGNPDTAVALWPDSPEALYYRLPEHNVEIRFRPTDFVQVNFDVNRKMINQAIALLDLKGDEQVLDLFCGLGNFTLPLARRAKHVLGIEAERGLVEGARSNATLNGIDNVTFMAADLYLAGMPTPWGDYRANKVLLDPPRSGAAEVLKHLSEPYPQRLVYVSCYPATLARDSAYLVHTLGYRLAAAGVMDMFPQTSHVESMALFVRP